MNIILDTEDKNYLDEDMICKNSIQFHGVDFNYGIVIEECAELIQAINKHRFNRKRDKENIYEEIADVEITLKILKLILKSNFKDSENNIVNDAILSFKEKKLARMKKVYETNLV